MFDTWMGGVGPDYKRVLEASLGPNGYRYAVTQSRFFFADELPAVREWALDRDRAATIVQPVLLIQGAKSPANFRDMINLLAGILTDAEIATLAGVGHLLPLQDPDGVGKLVADFVRRHPTKPERKVMRFTTR
jgi:pimeloyl-ACP methyl ester carboxylesterase